VKRRFITIKKADSGERLDKIIPKYLEDISRGEARRFISDGAVSIDGQRVRQNSRKVIFKQTITVYPSTNKVLNTVIEKPVVIFEDRWFVVVEKPFGMPSDETLQGKRGTLTDFLIQENKYKYLQTVHRLDMGTSGVMVLSKTPAATKILNRQFSERLVEKKYVALIHGEFELKKDVFISNLKRKVTDPRKFESVSTGGKKAVTEYQTRTVYPLVSLLDIKILTGRTHQIRIHMSENGHPVVGDRLYGKADDKAPRLMLHAYSLTFTCPRTAEKKQFTSKIPVSISDFAKFIPDKSRKTENNP